MTGPNDDVLDGADRDKLEKLFDERETRLFGKHHHDLDHTEAAKKTAVFLRVKEDIILPVMKEVHDFLVERGHRCDIDIAHEDSIGCIIMLKGEGGDYPDAARSPVLKYWHDCASGETKLLYEHPSPGIRHAMHIRSETVSVETLTKLQVKERLLALLEEASAEP